MVTTPAVMLTEEAIFLVGEGVKAILNHLKQAGQFNNLTQAQAEAKVAAIVNGLATTLPSPAELEAQGTAGGQPPAG